jgi:hypothetical protein
VAIYVVAIGTAIGVPLAIGIVALLGLTPPIAILMLAVAGGVAGAEVVGLLGVLVMSRFFQIYVSPDHLGAYNPWGVYREARWSEIEKVRPVNILGLRYLRATTSGSKRILSIPLFLGNREEFYWRICEYAGPEHPLTIALHAEQ